jgi:AraC-like DNA-binding protein
MRTAEPVRAGAALWDIAVPARLRLPGVSMAGFRDRSDGPVSIDVVPYPAVTLLIDLGDGVVVEGGGRRRRGSVVAGMAPGALRGGGRDVEVLQVRLSPLVARAAELTGDVIGLDDLWGSDAEWIQERLRVAKSWNDRFSIAEAALARRLDGGPDPEVDHVWHRMVANRGQVRVDALAAEVGWSRKRLWSRFRSRIGLTPKRAAQLIRFDHAAHRLAAGHSAAQVAVESGYVDQSHLTRDVVAFTGVTPTAVAVAPWLAVDDVAWP